MATGVSRESLKARVLQDSGQTSDTVGPSICYFGPNLSSMYCTANIGKLLPACLSDSGADWHSVFSVKVQNGHPI